MAAHVVRPIDAGLLAAAAVTAGYAGVIRAKKSNPASRLATAVAAIAKTKVAAMPATFLDRSSIGKAGSIRFEPTSGLN